MCSSYAFGDRVGNNVRIPVDPQGVAECPTCYCTVDCNAGLDGHIVDPEDRGKTMWQCHGRKNCPNRPGRIRKRRRSRKAVLVS